MLYCSRTRMPASTPRPKLSTSGAPAAPNRKAQRYMAAALAAIAFVVYFNSLSAGFPLDSLFAAQQDARIQSATAANLKAIFTQDYWYPLFRSGLFRPVTTLTFLFNHAILGNGANPAGYHAINLLLHIGNAWLVFAIALRLLSQPWTAFYAAALWTAHPVNTEAVANLVGRADELAAMAVLGGLLIYIRSGALEGRKRWTAAAALFAVSAFGLFSKEVAIVLIAMMALWDLVRGPNSWREWMTSRWPYYAAVLLSAATFFAARACVFGPAPSSEFPMVDNPLIAAPFWMARLTACKILLLDLGLLIFPWALSSDRSYNQIPAVSGFDAAAWGGLLIAVAVLAVVIARRRKDPALFWCAGFFAIALLPSSNLAILVGSIMAERFLYLPAAAFAIAATVLISRSPVAARLPLILGVVIALFGVRAIARNADWQDDYALAAHDVPVSPGSFKLHSLLAQALVEKSPANVDQALPEAERAWEIVRGLPPADVPTQIPMNLGAFYLLKGDRVGAPQNAEWYRKAATVLDEGKRDTQAYGDKYDRLQRAQGKGPALRIERQDIYLALGTAYRKLGMFDRARDAYVYGRKLDPTRVEFYGALAANDMDAGNPMGALMALEQQAMLDGGQPSTMSALRDAASKIPGAQCALTENGSLNLRCPALNACAALADLARANYEGRRKDDALAVKRSALELGCPAQTLEEAVPGR